MGFVVIGVGYAPVLPTYIRLGQNCQAVSNTLAYYKVILINALLFSYFKPLDIFFHFILAFKMKINVYL